MKLAIKNRNFSLFCTKNQIRQKTKICFRFLLLIEIKL
jgi:hypothetical protein